MVAETSYFRGIMEPNASPVREWKEQFHTLQAEKQVDSRGRSRSPERQVLKAHLMRTPVRGQPGQGKKQKLGESMGNTTWSEREAAWFDAEEMLIFKSLDVDESEEVAEAWRKKLVLTIQRQRQELVLVEDLQHSPQLRETRLSRSKL